MARAKRQDETDELIDAAGPFIKAMIKFSKSVSKKKTARSTPKKKETKKTPESIPNQI